MTEELNQANEKYNSLLREIKKKKEINKETESLLYLFFLAGWNSNVGSVQMIQ